MTLIICAIAVFIALCALWMVASVNRNLEMKTKYYAEMQMQSLSNSISDNANKIDILQRRISGLEKIIKDDEVSRELAADKLEEMEKIVNDIRSELISNG